MTEEHAKKLPYGRQLIDEDDIKAVVEVLRSDWLTTGPAVENFEAALADHTDANYVLSCSSGTAALHLAFLALGVGPGDLVIVPSISFIATANGAAFCGADILFCDVDPENGLMRVSDVKNLLQSLTGDEVSRIKAIIPVSLAGQVTDNEGLCALAQEHGWTMLIDSCHALGTRYQDNQGKDHKAGDCAFAALEIFSFHPVKTVAMGEGGAVTTNNPELYEKLKLFRNHGMVREPGKFQNATEEEMQAPWYYEMQSLGFNYRQSDIHCALGISQLTKLEKFVERRAELVMRYDSLLGSVSPHVSLLKKTANCQAGWHLYPLLIDFVSLGLSRTEFMKRLSECNIYTQVHYIPIHSQPYYSEKYGDLSRSGADQYYARTLSLPLFADMDEGDVDFVVASLVEIINQG